MAQRHFQGHTGEQAQGAELPGPAADFILCVLQGHCGVKRAVSLSAGRRNKPFRSSVLLNTPTCLSLCLTLNGTNQTLTGTLACSLKICRGLCVDQCVAQNIP